MDFLEWVSMFGRSADEADVKDALAQEGIADRIKIERQALSARKDIPGKGTTVVFTSETILRPDDPAAVASRPIMSAVMVILDQPNKKDLYTGPLPFQLSKTDSLDTLRARLGPPVRINEDNRTDAWLIDGLKLAASYAKDLQSLTQVSLAMPNSR